MTDWKTLNTHYSLTVIGQLSGVDIAEETGGTLYLYECKYRMLEEDK